MKHLKLITSLALLTAVAIVAGKAGFLTAALLFFAGNHMMDTQWVPSARVCSNSLGALSGTLILQRALEFVFTKFPALAAISMGFKELDGRVDNMLLNQTATTRIVNAATVNNFGTGATDVSTTDVSVTLDQKKEVHHKFTFANVNSTDRRLIDEQAMPIAIGIAKHIIAQVNTLWLKANYTNYVTVASGWDYDNTIRALRKKAAQLGIPEGRRALVINSDVYDALLGDTMVVAALNNPANADAIKEGRLPQVGGLLPSEYPDLAGNSENLVGFCCDPSATVFAARAPKDPREVAQNLSFPGIIDYITEPNSGFRVMVNQWIDPDTLDVNNRLVWLQGYAKGNAALGIRLNTAEPS